MARPHGYNDEIASKILSMIAEGMSLNKICKLDEMPSHDTVYRWLLEKKEFSDKYARAREAQAELFAHEIIEIADDTSGDTITDENGNEKPNNEWIQRSKLRVDSRKWIASKLLPKKYGDAMTLKGDKENPLEIGLAGLLDAAMSKRLAIAERDRETIDLPVVDVTETDKS